MLLAASMCPLISLVVAGLGVLVFLLFGKWGPAWKGLGVGLLAASLVSFVCTKIDPEGAPRLRRVRFINRSDHNAKVLVKRDVNSDPVVTVPEDPDPVEPNPATWLPPGQAGFFDIGHEGAPPAATYVEVTVTVENPGEAADHDMTIRLPAQGVAEQIQEVLVMVEGTGVAYTATAWAFRVDEDTDEEPTVIGPISVSTP